MRNGSRIMFELKGLDHFVRKHFEARMRSIDGGEQMTRMQHWVIGYLFDRSGKDIFQKDIEAEFKISRSTTSSMLTLMEKKGLITRESVTRDARLKKLTLTRAAIDMHMANMEAINEMEADVETSITPAEKAELMRIIEKIKVGVAEKMPCAGDETEDNA